MNNLILIGLIPFMLIVGSLSTDNPSEIERINIQFSEEFIAGCEAGLRIRGNKTFNSTHLIRCKYAEEERHRVKK